MNERHPDFLVHAWYKSAFEQEKDDWTPPYLDRAASQLLTTTYLTHIHDKRGRKVGMLGADVSLEWLRKRHNREDAEIHERYEQGFSEQSYSFIIDSDGTYLIHPMEERVLKMKIQDVMKATSDTLDDAMVKRMLNRESGTCRINNDGQNCWVFYSYVKYADWTVVIVVPEEIINYKGNLLANIILTVLFVGLLVIYLLSSHLIRKNMRPLSRFVTAARQVAQGDFDIELPEVKSREVDALRNAFKEMQTSLSNYVEELKKTTASNVAMDQELRIASDIQQRMLPKVYPPFPERTDIDIFGSMTYVSPKLIVESINRSVCQSNDSFMFVTLFMGVLDLANGRLLYTNAGHEPPVLVGGAHTRFLNANNNIPLGLRPDWEYTEQRSIVDRDTMLFLYTDGYTEAETVEREQFGKQRMCDEASVCL